ncbi:MAG: Fic family protein, partial [Nitrospinota bacterium]
PLIQALVAHYHLAAMHPFLDGNGRTARAIEALFLQRTGLKDTLFIAMSNYYYEEKNDYLKFLSQVRLENGDLTSFLKFGLRGITLQCNRLFDEIKKNVSKALFRNMMYSLFRRLQTKRRRVLADRQLEVLKILLDRDHSLEELTNKTKFIYRPLNNPFKALIRDISSLMDLNAVKVWKEKEKFFIAVRLEWPTEITETKFFETIKQLPKSKSHSFLP